MIGTERKLYYPMMLILSMPREKTAEALAKTVNKSGDTVLRILKDECIDANELICKAQQYFGDNTVDIIIDDTIINVSSI